MGPTTGFIRDGRKRRRYEKRSGEKGEGGGREGVTEWSDHVRTVPLCGTNRRFERCTEVQLTVERREHRNAT